MASAAALETNALGQMLAIKDMMLPHSPDDTETIGKALWLYHHQLEGQSIAIANGIGKAFMGADE
ncbi:hypothetical protein CZ809_00919 [Photobacterium piscicola]|uniref:Uncharacterized protein n=1 Tax=Photobacterium piscicola TaxID=1378299 RepID=A0A1T5HX72_9GAMM|nr:MULTISPECIES: hypothetical protein [Photobacterium]MEC6798201.1 hypothetical protein [Photobacterium sp. S4TG1]SKC31441.1 hypothetical protein CZ809_00919 [Photobacterium piscicola]